MSICFCLSAKQLNLYIMEFDNLKSDKSVEWLSVGLSDMIKEKFTPIDGVKIYGGEEVKVILKDKSRLLKQKSRTHNYLVMGNYTRELDRVTVNIQIINIANWEEKGGFSVLGLLNRIPNLADELYYQISDVIKDAVPTSAEAVLLLEPKVEAVRPKSQRYVKDLNLSMANALTDLEEAMDLNIGNRQKIEGTGERDGKFFRDFSFRSEEVIDETTAMNADLLEEILTKISTNPYSAEIGEPYLEVSDPNNLLVDLVVPVRYSLREKLIKDMINSLPHTNLVNDGSLIIADFSFEQYPISQKLIDDITTGDFRVNPVVQLMDRKGDVKKMLVDTSDPFWHRKSDFGDHVSITQNFSQLITSVVSGWSVQIVFESFDIYAEYRVVVPQKEVLDFTRVVVQFVPVPEIEKFVKERL